MAPRVLHIVESMDRGATENWLVGMLEHARATDVSMDWTFYCYLPGRGVLEGRALQLGARVIKSPVGLRHYFRFARALRKEIASKRYDIMHAHHDCLSGLYFSAAVGLPLRRRIVHLHNAGEAILTPSPFKQRIYRGVLRQACLSLADRVVGVSNHVLDTFLNGRPRRPGRDLVLYSGVPETSISEAAPTREEFRNRLGLAQNSHILLFAGRLVKEKNPLFVLRVLAELRKIDPHAVAVFAGTGELETELRNSADVLELTPHVRFLGWRNDLPDIMLSSDWFILPSAEQPMEGFGLAVVEAQLAGLRLLLSKGIADDPLLPNAAYRRLSLSDVPDAWASAAVELLRGPSPSPSAAHDALAASPMDMDRALSNLVALYV